MSVPCDLADLADGRRITAIETSPVSAPPGSAHPGEHLFVNCEYQACIDDLDPADVLQEAREDAAAILRQLLEQQALLQMVSVTISVYGRERRGGRRRIYRYSVLSEQLPGGASHVSGASIPTMPNCKESSEVELISALLES